MSSLKINLYFYKNLNKADCNIYYSSRNLCNKFKWLTFFSLLYSYEGPTHRIAISRKTKAGHQCRLCIMEFVFRVSHEVWKKSFRGVCVASSYCIATKHLRCFIIKYKLKSSPQRAEFVFQSCTVWTKQLYIIVN